MSLKDKILESLKEDKTEKKYDYGCVMLDFDLDIKNWNTLQKLIKNEDIYNDSKDTTFGREDGPHCTLLYGLHNTISDKRIQNVVDKIPKIDIKFGEITIFENSKDYDVIKFYIHNKELDKWNEEFKKFPYTSEFDEYHPHCTIAYLKKGRANFYLKELNKFIKKYPFKVLGNQISYSKHNNEKIITKIK